MKRHTPCYNPESQEPRLPVFLGPPNEVKEISESELREQKLYRRKKTEGYIEIVTWPQGETKLKQSLI